MSKEKNDSKVPKLRFKEFEGEDTWAEKNLSEVLIEHGAKSTGAEDVYSVSVHKGVVNQVEHLGRSFSAANTDNYKRVFPGDLIYTKSPTGDFPYGIIKQSKVQKSVIVSPLYGVFKPETIAIGVILDAYFEYPSNTFNYLSSIIQKGAKNTINIKNDTFLSKSLILPTNKKEQQKIAACLTSLDDLLAAESQRLEALQLHKKGLVQQLFPAAGEKTPKLRFKEFAGDGEWREEMLGHEDISSFVNEKVPLSELDIATYISTENMIADFNGVVLAAKLPQSGSFTKFIKGDILISNIRPYLKKIWQSNIEGTASNDVIVLRAGPKLTTSFLAFLLKTDAFINYVMKSAKGVKMPRGDKSDIQDYIIMFPHKDEQQKIAACLTSLDALITAQTAKITALKLHKKGLMQGLFPSTNNEA